MTLGDGFIILKLTNVSLFDDMSQKPEPTDMRTRVASEAAKLFAEHGFAGVSMRMIAQQVGIQAASLYNHYPDKESLYFAALAHAFGSRVQEIDAVRAEGQPAKERLTETLVALGRASTDDPVSTRLLDRELLDGDEERLRNLTETLFQEPFTRIAETLSETGEKARPSLMALYLVSLVHGYFALAPIWRYLDMDQSLPKTPEALGKDLTDNLLRYLGADAK